MKLTEFGIVYHSKPPYRATSAHGEYLFLLCDDLFPSFNFDSHALFERKRGIRCYNFDCPYTF
ncbi:hypothetical protein CHS0354_028724 [Potamilus streckersoni]|uniref:Uncharacterized protein n=1 Tax=Potamilus streckersoni TaxID=2493646 RepID=A0AAE0W498_9BIVA|nr:hypothetical protein CHS0354_028724 [Potamilus streckersoni]